MEKEEYLQYLRECGFEECELEKKWDEVLEARLRMKEEKKEQREITSATYERAEKRLTKRVNTFFGIK